MSEQVPADLNKCFASLFNLALANELSRRVWHERGQANEEYDTPGNLNAQGQTPLYWAVGCLPACHAHPIAHHGTKTDAAPGDSANEAAMLRCGDFAEVDWNSSDEASVYVLWLDAS